MPFGLAAQGLVIKPTVVLSNEIGKDFYECGISNIPSPGYRLWIDISLSPCSGLWKYYSISCKLA